MPPGWTQMVRTALELAGDMGVVGLALDNGEADAVGAIVDQHIARLQRHRDEQQCRADHGDHGDHGEGGEGDEGGEGASQNRLHPLDGAAGIFSDLEDRTPLVDTPAAEPPDRAFGEGAIVRSDGGREKP